MQKEICPICCSRLSSIWNAYSSRPCCKQNICHSCTYMHIKSIFSEGFVGDGRKKLTCPLGCGACIHDAEIRRSIKHANFSIRKHILGKALLMILKMTGFFYFFQSCFRRRLEDPYSNYYNKLTIAQSEQDDLRIYERWSLTMATPISPSSEQSNANEIYMRCPAPDCDYVWIASAVERRRKLVNEPKRSDKPLSNGADSDDNGNNTNNRLSKSKKKLFVRQAVSDWLTYKPPKPEKQNEYSQFWFDAEEIYYRDIAGLLLNNPTSERYPDSKDGRRCICPKCHALFCGLCRHPWRTVRHRFFIRTKESHDGKTCHSYSAQFTRNDINGSRSQYLASSFFASRSINAKMCPGCSIWVERISGCNHMTCRCGAHWCYVCETRWNRSHYSCVLRNNDDSSSFCVIS